MTHSSGVPELPPRFCVCLQPVATLVLRNSVLGKSEPGHNPGQQIQNQHVATEAQTSDGEQAEGLLR